MRKLNYRLPVVIGLIFVSGLSLSARLEAEQVVLEPESRLWLVGDSTLHVYESQASALEVQMKLSTPTVASSSLYEDIHSGKMKGLDVRVPVDGLKSGKNKLDNNMHKALKSAENPDITFHLTGYEVAVSTTPNEFSLLAKGDLTVAGKTNPIELQAVVTAGSPVQIRGNKKLLMTDYGVKPPSILGAIRAYNEILVNFDLGFTKASNK